MVRGLDKFISHFKGMENSYVLIGGCACDIWLSSLGIPFRLTKDIDMVIIMEALNSEFVQAFWNFIKLGHYQSLTESSDKPKFYRFRGPEKKGFPFMIELLSKNSLDLPHYIHLTPIPTDADISSLSAILLDDEYYKFILEEKITVGNIPIIPPQCLIPLKAKAYLDLKRRKESGDQTVKVKDVKKHRNDIFRLSLSIAPAEHYSLPSSIENDVQNFLEDIPPNSQDWTGIKAALKDSGIQLPAPEAAIERIENIFNI